ncbi:MAG: ABC transporter permease [Acidobacteriota bacterium]|nr:ABC transporter permease [Acidobacteriota bacterium]
MQLTPLRRSLSAGHQAAGGATGVTGTYFGVLGIDAFIGRTILPEDDVSPGSHAVVMLDHDYWLRAFGGSPDAIGQTLRVAGGTYEIIGVAASRCPRPKPRWPQWRPGCRVLARLLRR